MNTSLALFSELSDADTDALFAIAQEVRVGGGTRFLEEGKPAAAVYVVLEGRVDLVSGPQDEIRLAEAGPGEILGEIAFLERGGATLSAVAAEDSLLLSIPVDALARLLEADPGLATRFYRAVAVSALRRLQARSEKLRALLLGREGGDSTPAGGPWQRLSEALTDLRAALRDADQVALSNRGELPRDRRDALHAQYRGFIDLLNRELGVESGLSETARKALGSRVQADLLPHLLLSETAERWYSKPRGYAGDYFSIELMYRNQPTGIGRLGPLIDEWMLESPPTRAARNRRGLLSSEILAEIRAHPGEETLVTTLASGPAAEVLDAFSRLEDPSRLKAHLVDIDLQALSFVADRLAERGWRKRAEVLNSNLIYLATGRSRLEIPPQHFVYSVGLIDYFDDRFVVKLLDYVYDLLRPGGRVILGNFHPRNPERAFMDYVLDWPLILRDEEDMNRLFQASRFGEPCSRILFEEQQINLFAEGIRR